MSFAIVFPGQGSQSVGMGKELYDVFAIVRDRFAEASEIIGFPLHKLCFEGPAEELTRTDNAQPALLTLDVACYLLLQNEGLPAGAVPVAAAGHSLGEYAALVAAGVLTFEQALRLVQRRGQLMQQAPTGTMAAVLGLSEEALGSVVDDAGQVGRVVPANRNAPGQVVLSGEPAAVERACALARERGARRVMPLSVSGAFHSPLMREAGEELAGLLKEVPFDEARFPVITNVDGARHREAGEIRDALIRQMTSSVLWEKSVTTLRGLGATRFIECGPGGVLSGLIRRCDPDATVMGLNDIASLQALQKEAGAWT